jgi:parallel beta-helix repeat protein
MKKKYVTIGIILLFMGTCIISSPAQKIENPSQQTSKGNWLYVGGSGPGNYTKIQNAINDSNDGDTVFVFSKIPFPYVEHLVIDKSINLIGQDKNSTKIDCGLDKNVICITKDNVKISNFTIKNSYTGISYVNGINAGEVKNILITHCKIIDNKMEGLWIHYCNNVTISYNTIDSNGHYGIGIDGTNGNCIIGNEILNNPSHGMCLWLCSNNTIVNNTISSNGGVGILFSSGVSFSKICNNVISNNNWDGIFLQSSCPFANITDNTILDNGHKGILIKSYSHNATIFNNIIMRNNNNYPNTENGGGICIYETPDVVIIGNTVKYNIHEEIYLSEVSRAKVISNEISSGYMSMEDLYMINCFYSDVSKNNFRFVNENEVTIGFSSWGTRDDFYNILHKLNSVSFEQNYWNRFKIFPKIIRTPYHFKFGYPDYPGFSLTIPFYILDENPARRPYDIPGKR